MYLLLAGIMAQHASDNMFSSKLDVRSTTPSYKLQSTVESQVFYTKYAMPALSGY